MCEVFTPLLVVLVFFCSGTATAARAVAASLDLKLLWKMGALPLTKKNKKLLRHTMPAGMVPVALQDTKKIKKSQSARKVRATKVERLAKSTQ